MELQEIQLLIRQQRYEVSFHAQQERLEENLDIEQIEEAIVHSGEILEQYPDDPRGRELFNARVFWKHCDPSCFRMGDSQTRQQKSVAADNRLQADTAEMA